MSELSYAKGKTDTPLIELTIGQYFDQACRDHAERDALISRHQDQRLTYAALRHKVDALACALLRLGLNKGRSSRHLVPEQCRVDADAIRQRQSRA